MKPNTLSFTPKVPGMKLVSPRSPAPLWQARNAYVRRTRVALGKERQQGEEGGVCGNIPPHSHNGRRDAANDRFHTEVSTVENQKECHERKAPEQHFTFQNPYALEVRFDGLFLVEEEPRGDGEEDDDAHFVNRPA